MKHITNNLNSNPQYPVIKKARLMNGGRALLIFSIALLMSSCAATSFKNTSRVGQVGESKVALTSNVVDVDVNFDSKIQATSEKTRRVHEAKEQAYYRAIVNNNIDILVDPIYEVYTKSRKSIATVMGYAGNYVNIRTEKQENQQVYEQELINTQASFEQSMAIMDRKIQELDKFSKVNAVATEDLKTHLIIVSGTGEKGTMSEEINTNISIIDKYNTFENGGSIFEALPNASPKEQDNPGLLSMIKTKMKRNKK
jgi:hypothetical protein